MKKMMKLVSAILTVSFLCITLLLGLFGCADDSEGDSLYIAFVEAGYGRKWLENWCKAYNDAHPNEPINFELEGSSQLTGEIGTRLDTNTDVADIFMGLTTNWQQWAAKGLLEPLDDLYATEVNEGQTLLEFMQPGCREYGKVNGRYYAIPVNDGVTGLVYNKTMFEEKGWEVPETVEELYELCTTINNDPVNKDGTTTNDIAPFAWGGQVISYWDFPVINWWAQYEGAQEYMDFYKYDSPEVFNQRGREKALEVFQNLICAGNGTAKNSVPGSMSKNHIQSQMDFIQGRAAMIPNGAWIEYEMRNNIEPGTIEIAMMPTPAIEDAKTDAQGNVIRVNNTMMGDFFIIPSAAKNKEAAKKFMAFVSSLEMSRLYTKSCGAPRPFLYTASDIEGLSTFAKSCLEIWENSVNLYEVSSSKLFYKNLVNKWPSTGAPYGLMITDNETASSIVAQNYNSALTNWATWVAEANK